MIPTSWSDSPSYDTLTWQSRDKKTIEVHHPTASWASHIPHVIGNSPECGKPSGHLYLTDKFLKDGDLAKGLGGMAKVHIRN